MDWFVIGALVRALNESILVHEMSAELKKRFRCHALLGITALQQHNKTNKMACAPAKAQSSLSA